MGLVIDKILGDALFHNHDISENVKRIEFDTTYTKNGEPVGSVYWNSDRDTLELLTGSGEVQVGEDLFFHCINQSGSTIHKGTAVMYAGSIGASGKMKVLPAVANGTVSSIVILGVAKQDILNGYEGKILCWGQLSGFNTSTFGADKILYLDPANNGGYTITEPQAPNLKYPIASTLDSKNNGNIAVRAIFTPNLSELNDVQITSVQDGDALVWNDTNGRWENAPVASGSPDEITFTRTDGLLSSIDIDGTIVTISRTNNLISSYTDGTSTWNITRDGNNRILSIIKA